MKVHGKNADDVILRVENLQKSYNGKKAVDGISFDVKKGEIFGILGPNGAGKTTTLEMIETLRTIDGGQVLLNGIDVKQKPQEVKRVIGVQLQSSSFFDQLNLTELLLLFGEMYSRQVDPLKLLEEVELQDKAT